MVAAVAKVAGAAVYPGCGLAFCQRGAEPDLVVELEARRLVARFEAVGVCIDCS
ncbi:MAG: hypothetical protein ACKO9F_14465 [Caldilinea sp.]